MSTFESRKLSALADTLRASGAAGRRNDPLAAFFWVTVATAGFAGLGGLAKYVIMQGLDPLQVIFFRNFFCLILMLPLLYWRGPALATSRQFHLYGVRAGLAWLSMMAWFCALSLMPYSEVTAMSFLAPLFATLFAVVWLGEVVRIRRWTALAVGFIGAMIILRPGHSAFGLGQMFALASALSSGIIGPLLKQMTGEDDADKIVFISTMLLAPMSLIPALFVWQWPALALLPFLVGMGFMAIIGHVALMRGYACADASLVSTFEFSRLPFVVAISYVAFGETTDVWTWIGAVIIFGAASYITRREALLAHAAGKTRCRDVSDPLCLTPVQLRF